MTYQVFIPGPILMIPILVMTTKGIHRNSNNDSSRSDVVVTYFNHADAGIDDRILYTEKNTDIIDITSKLSILESTTEVLTTSSNDIEDPPQDGVVFVPNEKDVSRNEDYLQNDDVNIQKLLGGHKTVHDALKNVKLETEIPINTDIIFIMGKNNENSDPTTEKPKQKRVYDDYPSKNEDSTPTPKLDCKNLSCTNTVNSICGEKIENYKLKQRLFLNECYFRKVNCNFKNAINRYKRVRLEKCKNYKAHYNATPFTYKPKDKMKPVQVNNTRRSSASRRSMTMSLTGQFCSHACPSFCSEHYDPQCAVSDVGIHRVFLNHCTLDRNSCANGIAWRNVPLAECVGGKKADMRQNAGFIGWMQRVGIVDRRGRLVLNP